MSLPHRALSSSVRPSSVNQGSTGQSPALMARINEKKLELENLKQLRDLSAGLAGQMQMLEEKLATLADGTEAVAAVLSNWHNVLRAIHMASGERKTALFNLSLLTLLIAKIPNPQGAEDENGTDQAQNESEVPLPQTLVRIPTQQE
ncbi:MAG: hypothetical protein M4579_006843 [Chaenotheca gracillima]|nr:MAG: hypothetical protein M4579_006843 [Chaenotheca gracillima]